MSWINVGGAAVGAYGSQQAKEGAEEGAAAQALAEADSVAFQRKMFDEEMARLAPRHETSTQYALPLMQQYIDEGQIDQTNMPLYGMQNEAGMNFLREQGMDNPYAMNRFSEGLGAAENEAGYARLQDMLQIGLGASGAAGAGAQNFARGQANSLINSGNALAQGQMTSDNINQSMYRNLAGSLGQLPAYWSQNQQQRPTNLQGPQVPLGGIR